MADAPPGQGAGATVFAGSCSACHSLIGNERRHLSGGDLLGYALSRRSLAQYTAEMPLRRPLSPAQERAVVAFVARAQATAARR